MDNSKKKSWKVKALWILIIIITIIALVSTVAILVDAPSRREIQNLVIGSVDFNNLQDGTYIGEYNGTKSNIRDTKLEVTISGGKITNIKILKGAIDKNGLASKLAGGLSVEDLFDNVEKSKSLDVDTISGATLTAKIHLKALENALKKAEKN